MLIPEAVCIIIISRILDFFKTDPGKADYTVVEGQFVPNASMFIPRADVADFIVSSLQKPDWDRKCMAIGRKS